MLVCGGRDSKDNIPVWDALFDLLEKEQLELVITGCSSGVDQHAVTWAYFRAIPCMSFPAPWGIGKKAGPIRNGWMLKYGKPDLVLAFPGGRGTADMVQKARDAGVEVKEITP